MRDKGGERPSDINEMHGTIEGAESPEEELARARFALALAREDFWRFRLLINPQMHQAWWQQDVAKHINQFYADFIAGKRPKLILQAPPQHGKSEQIRDFACWIAGRCPDAKTIFTSYSDELPWIKPWSATPGQNVPQNAVTNRSGCNVILLWLARNRGWSTPRFNELPEEPYPETLWDKKVDAVWAYIFSHGQQARGGR
jgi:N-terminal domain of anti-restriction factor ArdC